MNLAFVLYDDIISFIAFCYFIQFLYLHNINEYYNILRIVILNTILKRISPYHIQNRAQTLSNIFSLKNQYLNPVRLEDPNLHKNNFKNTKPKLMKFEQTLFLSIIYNFHE